MYEAIASAIEKPLKGDGFERCAVELLREAYYPNLRPVEGGNDAGSDGVGEFSGTASVSSLFRRLGRTPEAI